MTAEQLLQHYAQDHRDLAKRFLDKRSCPCAICNALRLWLREGDHEVVWNAALERQGIAPSLVSPLAQTFDMREFAPSGQDDG